MLGEVTFAVLGALFLIAQIRTFVSSLQLLLFGNVPNTTIGVVALALFAASALAPLVARVYGPRRALAGSAAVLGLATLLSAVSRLAWVDLVLAAAGVLAGTWWFALLHASRPPERPSPWPVALPLALVTDLALRTALRTVPPADLPLAMAVPLVLIGGLLFVAAGLAALSGERGWASPGPRGAVGLAAVGLLLAVTESLAFNGAQAAASGGIGLGPEPARSTQLGALVVGVGIGAGAFLLTSRYPRRPVAAAALVLGALVSWIHVPVLSLAGGAALAAGAVVAASALVMSAPAAGRGALAVAAPAAIGWVAFVASGFLHHAYYVNAVPWVAAGVVALAVLAAPSVAGPRLARGPAALLGALALVIPVVALLPFTPPPVAEPQATFRVMTYNVHQGFNAFETPALDEIADTIARESPDVVLLQEVVRGWVISEQHDVLGVLAERLGMHYVFHATIGDLYGNAILSRMPMTDVRRIAFPREASVRHQPRGAMSVTVGGVTIVNTHLDHNRDATDVRLRQIREILRTWEARGPLLLGGDLNAEPASPELDLIGQSGFADLALAAGSDEPTSPGDRPQRRIDYVLGIGLNGSQAHVVASTASDHRALVVNVTRLAR
ncbi:MAG TPA: endonuclease/exonuclease/phosphatase family protein [Candidatus Limnocylindria bacterium]|nr:endonuclease/exonuclease/phosphatase family protein [Candidatus Limnocylindria bacterium]